MPTHLLMPRLWQNPVGDILDLLYCLLSSDRRNGKRSPCCIRIQIFPSVILMHCQDSGSKTVQDKHCEKHPNMPPKIHTDRRPYMVLFPEWPLPGKNCSHNQQRKDVEMWFKKHSGLTMDISKITKPLNVQPPTGQQENNKQPTNAMWRDQQSCTERWGRDRTVTVNLDKHLVTSQGRGPLLPLTLLFLAPWHF